MAAHDLLRRAVLFEALTDKRLLEGEDEGDIALGVLLGSFPAPSSVAPHVPPGSTRSSPRRSHATERSATSARETSRRPSNVPSRRRRRATSGAWSRSSARACW